jgi:CRISPR-associated protein Csx17
MEKLVEFFDKRYRPTPVFSPWNTGGGMDEKKLIVFSITPSWKDYWTANRDSLLAHGFPPPENDTIPTLPTKAFDLKCAECSLPSTESILIKITLGKGKKPKSKIQIVWSEAARQNLFAQMEAKRAILEQGIKFTGAVINNFVAGNSEFAFDVKNETALNNLGATPGVQIGFRTKTGTKKTVMATLTEELKNDNAAVQALSLGREFFDRFQDDDADQRKLLEEFRDACPPSAVESLDAVFTTRSGSRSANNPLFLNRGMGEGGNDELFRKSWEHYCAFRTGKIASICEQSLTGRVSEVGIFKNEIGTPFFPDAQKAYNIGTGWVQSTYPFNALDYVLAAEGAFAMRGTVARPQPQAPNGSQHSLLSSIQANHLRTGRM